MAQTQDPFKHEAQALVSASLQEIAPGNTGGQQGDDLLGQFTTPPSFEMGQAALPCFPFAKSLRSAPQKIAEMIANNINNSSSRNYVEKVVAVGGYLNFYADFSKFGKKTVHDQIQGNYFKADLLPKESREKIVIEYSQPNSHKALHVGHLRCLCLGDSVSNLLEFIGHKVVRSTYPGDMGANTAKTLWYIKHKTSGELPKSNQAEWLGEIYAKADSLLEAERGTEKEAKNREELLAIMKNVDDETSSDYKLWKTTRDWCFDEMKNVYSWLGVHFDIWYTESECDKPSRQLVKDLLKQGKFVLSEGAIGIDLNPYKLGFALFLKSDGNSLYATKDLELLRRKFSDPEVTRSIYVVDSRQKLHFAQLFKAAELVGYPQAAKSVHLPYETVNTEAGKAFSSRSLNGLQLMELRRAMENKVKTDYLERYRGDWSDEDIEKTATNVAIGALKYGMLRVDNNTAITFSLAEWLRLDGDTGPYLQYVHARCCNILEKQGRAPENFEFVSQEAIEKELTFFLSRFNDFALQAALQYRPSIVAGYLFDLAKLFNRFYEQCPIKTAEGELKNTRLSIVAATASTIRTGLALLGIPSPSKM